jgi:tetratricopeptide (TPR) repeat protein/tRNA A-37 threonylcarbamoyl transferase component Bud32
MNSAHTAPAGPAAPGGPALEDLVEELTNRVQAGEAVDVEAYAARHPEQAQAIRDLFPALQVLAAISGSSATGRESAESLPAAGTLGDFRLICEVGRGGMGVVYEAEQISLSRRVALKVLPFAATMDPRQLQRFKNEAQAAAGLQHQNIVPVYFVGVERGVHYYAMQFIDGQTVAAVIRELRQANGLDCTAPLGATPTLSAAGLATERSVRTPAYFRTVAQLGQQAAGALQHAHDLGVIHRDVKPGNLMLDGRGNLWVTDFGLARVQADASLTLTGDLVGTVRYMSPEQASGGQALIDHCTDVYSLGATLYELLTLQPAFQGNSRQELLLQIALEEPKPPRRVNNAIPAELETIVLKAMEKNSAERYATAQELADDLQRVLDDRPILARRPSWRQVARKWARRHREAVAAAAVCLVVSLAATVGSGAWLLGERAGRQKEAEAKVLEALEAAGPGLRAGNPQDPALIVAAQRAEAQFNSGAVGPKLRDRVAQLLRDVGMLARLERGRLQSAAASQGMPFDLAGSDRLYAEAFTGYGLDITALDTQQTAESLRASPIATRLISGLDDWAAIKDLLQDRSGIPMRAAAHRADDDPWRRRLRLAAGQRDRAALDALAQEEEALGQPPANLVLLARALTAIGSWAAAERLLLRTQPGHAADFWINFELAGILDRKKPPDPAGAACYYQAALALRPQAPVVCNNLGVALRDHGKLAQAEATFRKVIELNPDYAEAYNNLGVALKEQGKAAQAEAAYRQALKHKYGYPTAHRNLGIALFDLGRPDEAMAEFQEALQLDPNDGAAHHNLGVALWHKGRLEEAIAEFQAAIRLDPRDVLARNGLGVVLQDQGRLDEAIGQHQQVLQIDPKHAKAHCELGNALKAKGDVDGAIREYRLALDTDPRLALAHYNLGNALLYDKQDADGAIREYRLAIESHPRDADTHANLGQALRRRGRLDEAGAAYREAIRLAPKDAQTWSNLGEALRTKKDLDEAMTAFRQAIDLDPKLAQAHGGLGLALLQQGRFAEARTATGRCLELLPLGDDPARRLVSEKRQRCERLLALDEKLPAILNGETAPADAAERIELAQLCWQFKRRHATAARFFAEAFAERPRLADDLQGGARYDAACAAALAAAGQGQDAAKLDDKERASLRRQALEWLRADLTAYRRLLDKEPDKAGPAVREQMQHWQQGKDFAGVRDPEALARLPTAERADWQTLWQEAEALRQRGAGARQSAAPKSPEKSPPQQKEP